ncbi:virulence factor TspB C-terminal domain-related protein, partial [Nitrosomonas ureae]
GEDVPTGIPTLTPDQKKGLGLESKPTRDSSGNVTGREDTTTEIEAVDAGTTDNPGRVIIKETQTTVKYDINNNQISSTTNTSYSSQPQPDKPQQNFEIKFDEVPPAELQTHNVQATLTGNSWGEGTCPPDIPIDISYYPMNLVIPTAPVCDTAEKINPLVLLLASIAGVYIVSGVRSTEVK